MIPHQVPNCPWEEVATDYFTLHSQDYLLVVDYYSKYPKVIPMRMKTAEATIAALKSLFAIHGIPSQLIADNMPFSSKKFKQFASDWNFQVITSSPTYPQSNGLAERYVQTIKKLLKKAIDSGSDEALALLEFCNTPITGMSYTPAQLLMSRRLHGCLLMTASSLVPNVASNVKKQLQEHQDKQTYY